MIRERQCEDRGDTDNGLTCADWMPRKATNGLGAHGMSTGGGKRRFRLGARPVEHGTEHQQRARAEDTPRGTIPHLSLAALNEPAQQLSRTKHRNNGSPSHVAQDPAIASAVEHERRRIAADVHDLIMQDLALALAQARMLADDTPKARTVVDAGARALANARDLVGGLSARQTESIAGAVISGAQRAARHVPIAVVAQEAPPIPQPDAQTFSTIVHIAREAVTNAVKHGHPTKIEVTLECPEEWRLRISDDGCGFDAEQAADGFGLQSMRRQAHALGGRLRVTGVPGQGTSVEALLP
jgi:signal transduction histidine kinase